MTSLTDPSQQLSAMDRRRIALENIDNAKFSLYHVRYVALFDFTDIARAILVAGVGL
jgi:hypothetical protein